MRKVQVYKYEKVTGSDWGKRVKDKIGLFRQFGVSYDRYDSGPGNYTTAIVEMPDGSVRNVAIEDIKFLEQLEGELQHETR